MRYLPHTREDISEMLEVVGVENLDALFSTIPEECRYRKNLNLPEPLTEWELINRMRFLAGKMFAGPDYKMFMGGGSYHHYIPESVSYLLSRSEFSTAYTPYQPEVSQGTLQAIFEYQTLVARLLGMEVANASLYDGASALAEALLMAIRITRRKRIAISSVIHPSYRSVVKTYLEPTGCEIVELPYLEDGQTDLSFLNDLNDLAAVAVQSPNFFGCIEELSPFANKTHEKEALFVSSFTEPLAYGLIKNPGSQDADIVCGEGQSFGIPQSFGGPGLGIFASKMKYVRNMPGRLVGETVDAEGKRGFVLTLATREQHIRRAKATSNICTNSGFCALTVAMYMASLGGSGLRELSKINHDKSEYFKKQLHDAGFKSTFDSCTFNEFVVRFPDDFSATYEQLLEKKMVAGLPLATFYPELKGHYLLCVTETKSKAEIDELVREVRK